MKVQHKTESQIIQQQKNKSMQDVKKGKSKRERKGAQQIYNSTHIRTLILAHRDGEELVSQCEMGGVNVGTPYVSMPPHNVLTLASAYPHSNNTHTHNESINGQFDTGKIKNKHNRLSLQIKSTKKRTTHKLHNKTKQNQN